MEAKAGGRGKARSNAGRSKGKAAKRYDLARRGDVIDLVRAADRDEITAAVAHHLQHLLDKHGLGAYRTLFLLDDCDDLDVYHADKLYPAAAQAAGNEDILLILNSLGGKIGPAYLTAKTCKRLCRDKFVVAVPRRAKSAATLLCLGADEIHLGLMSELGPIDPQIKGYPALGLLGALNKLAELAARFPGSSEMFARYLTSNLSLIDLGHFERAGESAAQYAERLLQGKALPGGRTPQSLARHFVDHYKDHGFVIDVDEASELLGATVRTDTPEAACANEVYEFVAWLKFVLDRVKKQEMFLVGDTATGLVMRERDGE